VALGTIVIGEFSEAGGRLAPSGSVANLDLAVAVGEKAVVERMGTDPVLAGANARGCGTSRPLARTKRSMAGETVDGGSVNGARGSTAGSAPGNGKLAAGTASD